MIPKKHPYVLQDLKNLAASTHLVIIIPIKSYVLHKTHHFEVSHKRPLDNVFCSPVPSWTTFLLIIYPLMRKQATGEGALVPEKPCSLN